MLSALPDLGTLVGRSGLETIYGAHGFRNRQSFFICLEGHPLERRMENRGWRICFFAYVESCDGCGRGKGDKIPAKAARGKWDRTLDG